MIKIKKSKWKIIIILICVLLLRVLYVKVSYDLFFKSGNISYSPEESKDSGTFIRLLQPSKREYPYNEDYNIIFKNVWLEYAYKPEYKFFWISDNKKTDILVINFKYSFKNKSTGEIIKKIPNNDESGLVLGRYPEDVNVAEMLGVNLLFDNFYSTKINQEYKYIIRKNNTIITLR